jgi:aromatic ring-opening dioxygenase catalytic subunit (LigB family)
MSNPHLTVAQQQLEQWQSAPHARFCHPREEHLLPLHVCFGAAMVAGLPAQTIFNEPLMGHKVAGFRW